MLARMWRKGNHCTLLMGMYNGVATMENNIEVPQENKNRASVCSSISTYGYISKGNKIIFSKWYLYSRFIAKLFTEAKVWKQPKCLSIDEWIKKMWYVYRHTHTQQNIIQPLKRRKFCYLWQNRWIWRALFSVN